MLACYGEARRSEEWQRAMAEINRALLAGSDTDGVLQLVAHWAAKIAHARSGGDRFRR